MKEIDARICCIPTMWSSLDAKPQLFSHHLRSFLWKYKFWVILRVAYIPLQSIISKLWPNSDGQTLMQLPSWWWIQSINDKTPFTSENLNQFSRFAFIVCIFSLKQDHWSFPAVSKCFLKHVFPTRLEICFLQWCCSERPDVGWTWNLGLELVKKT